MAKKSFCKVVKSIKKKKQSEKKKKRVGGLNGHGDLDVSEWHVRYKQREE